MSQSLVLYTRPECGLCEEAVTLAAGLGISLDYRDISQDLSLLRRYRDRIPVLAHPDTGEEIGWPFDADQILALCRAPA